MKDEIIGCEESPISRFADGIKIFTDNFVIDYTLIWDGLYIVSITKKVKKENRKILLKLGWYMDEGDNDGVNKKQWYFDLTLRGRS